MYKLIFIGMFSSKQKWQQFVKECLSELEKHEVQGEEDTLDEFSGAGAIAGFTAPLGMSGQDLLGYKKIRKSKIGK